MWFDRNALVTSLVHFSHLIERKSFLFAKSFIFISDENGMMIPEIQECLVLVISGYLIVIFLLNFTLFAIMFVLSRSCLR